MLTETENFLIALTQKSDFISKEIINELEKN